MHMYREGCIGSMQRLSLYAENLPPEAKTRYLAKISVIDGADPLSDGVFGEEVDVTPPVI